MESWSLKAVWNSECHHHTKFDIGYIYVSQEYCNTKSFQHIQHSTNQPTNERYRQRLTLFHVGQKLFENNKWKNRNKDQSLKSECSSLYGWGPLAMHVATTYMGENSCKQKKIWLWIYHHIQRTKQRKAYEKKSWDRSENKSVEVICDCLNTIFVIKGKTDHFWKTLNK